MTNDTNETILVNWFKNLVTQVHQEKSPFFKEIITSVKNYSLQKPHMIVLEAYTKGDANNNKYPECGLDRATIIELIKKNPSKYRKRFGIRRDDIKIGQIQLSYYRLRFEQNSNKKIPKEFDSTKPVEVEIDYVIEIVLVEDWFDNDGTCDIC